MWGWHPHQVWSYRPLNPTMFWGFWCTWCVCAVVAHKPYMLWTWKLCHWIEQRSMLCLELWMPQMNNVVPVLGDNPVVLGAMDASNEQCGPCIGWQPCCAWSYGCLKWKIINNFLSILWLRPTHEPYSPVASFPSYPVQKLGDSLGTRLILQWTWDLQMLLEKNTWSFIYVGQERMMTSLFFQWCHHALLCWVIILKLQPSDRSFSLTVNTLSLRSQSKDEVCLQL